MHNPLAFAPHKLLSTVIMAATLAACTGGGNTSSAPTDTSSAADSSSSMMSSSSTPMSSSVPMESSSSSVVTTPSSSSAPSSSSEASSSSVPASSSSEPMSSSSSSLGNGGNSTVLDSDGTFTDGQGLFVGNATAPFTPDDFTWNGEMSIAVTSTSTETWHAQLTHDFATVNGQEYTICFRAKASANREISVNVDQGGTPGYASIMGNAETVQLSTVYQDSKITFSALESDNTARLTMSFGALTQSDVASVQVDDLGVYEGGECGDPSDIPAPPTGSGGKHIADYIAANNQVPPITTNGNKVLFDGKPGSIAGVSLFWSNTGEGEKFYSADVVSQLNNNWDAKLIRAAMAVDDFFSIGGYLQNPQYNLDRVKRVVDAAIANNMYVIIDWHTHNAEEHENDAIAFFEEMARTYKDEPNVIYEIYNEPDCLAGVSGIGTCTWPERTQWPEIKEYAVKVVDAIRAIDSDNLIIVGTPFYSQDVDVASGDPIENEINIAYTLHFYAATHKQDIRSKAVTALKNNVPLFVTEWGSVEASGDGGFNQVETDIWMQFLYDNDISHANWSLTDKNEGASILTSGGSGGWDENNLTDSGRYVKQTIIDWNKSIRPAQ